MQRRLHLAPVRRRVAALGGGIVGAPQLDHLALGVLHGLPARDEVGVAQPHLLARRQSEELLGRVLHEVVALDPQLAREADLARARACVLRVVDGFQLLRLALRIVLDHHLERPQHGHAPQRAFVERLAHRELEHAGIDHAVGLGDADALDEIADRRRRHAAPTQARNRGHARIVPARDVPAPHQLRQHALGQHRVGHVQPRELVLARPRRHRQVLDEPVVERAVVLELQRADRVRDVLDRIRLAVRVVVARVDLPLRPRARVGGVQDAVEHGVAQVDVAARHIDPGAQHARAVRELARPHAPEQVEVLLHAAVAPGAVRAGLRQRAAARAHLLLALVVDVGLARLDQVLGPRVELLEVVGRVIEVLAPVEAEPAHVALDGVDVLLLLLGRIGVVEAQVAAAAELLRHPEVEADRLGVPDVQVAVRLGRKPRDHASVPPLREVGGDDVADEVLPRLSQPCLGYRHVLALSSCVTPPVQCVECDVGGPSKSRRSRQGGTRS